MSQQILFSRATAADLDRIVRDMNPNGVWVVADSNTAACVWPCLREALAEDSPVLNAHLVIIEAGDVHKDITAVTAVWEQLSRLGATRRSLVVNLGGGMVTDLGGFAAATFKRGIRFINIPTTLLGAVDAAVGGKTGINLGGLKNEIGAFRPADAVIISNEWFEGLPQRELLSGYAEMLKHSLLSGTESLARHLAFDITHENATSETLAELMAESVRIKADIVAQDPTEKGLRKSLNLGHTPGHAFETHAMHSGKPVPHGYAVAWGLVFDLTLSTMQLGFDSGLLRQVATYVRDHYGVPKLGCDIYPELIGLMRHDKKNATADAINFTLLHAPGQVALDRTATPKEIEVAFDVMRDLLGI